jgi:dolichyl-phosphate-mannose-protein mannosyltransferase
MRPALRDACKGLALVLLGAVLIGFESFLSYKNLGRYDDFYDGGVYLESARMMNRGAHLYIAIFDSQPPFWLPIIYGSFRMFGESFFAGQLPIATAGLIIALAVAAIARQSSGWAASCVAASIIILSPLELKWSRTVSPEVPASALAVVGIMAALSYSRHGNRISLCLASLLVACSVLVKLLGLFTLPVLFLIVAVRHWRLFRTRRPVRKSFVEDEVIILGTLTMVTACAILPIGAREVWKQAVEFHWAAKPAESVESLSQATKLLGQVFADDWLLTVASLLGVLAIIFSPEGIILGGWVLVCLIGLLYQHPLFSHHLVVLIPPLAIAAGVGWSEFWRRIARLVGASWANGHRGRIITAGLLALPGILMTVFLSPLIAHRVTDQVRSVERMPVYTDDIRAAELMKRLTVDNETVLTDAQGIAFLAARDVPPQLTDTSFVRISTGYLSAREIIAYSERDEVQLFLSWTGRLATVPGIIQWAGRHFPYHTPLGPGRVLYSIRPPLGSSASAPAPR